MAVTMSLHRRASPGLSTAKKRIWGDDLLQLMIGPPPPPSPTSERPEDQGTMTTLDLLGCSSGSSSSATASSSCSSGTNLELDMELPPPPSGWEKRLDLKAGRFYYVHLSTGRSTYDHPGFAAKDDLPHKRVLELLKRPGEDLDLKLGSSASSSKPVYMTGRSSFKQMPGFGILTSTTRSSDSTGSEASGVLLTSCKACLMYVMLSRLDPRCPKCGCRVAMESYHQPARTKKRRIR